MKIIIVFYLVIIVSIVSSYNYKPKFDYNYIFVELYQLGDRGCHGNPRGGIYLKNDYCPVDDSNPNKLICNNDGTITNYYYTESGCSGKAVSQDVPTNNCTEYYVKYNCVNSFEVPSNTFQYYNTYSKCLNDPDWKNDIWKFTYNYLDTCIIQEDYSVSLSCNSTTAIQNIYNSTTICSNDDNTGYSYLEEPVCSKENPVFSVCDTNNYF